MNYDDPRFVIAFAALMPVLGVGFVLLVGLRKRHLGPLLAAVLLTAIFWGAFGGAAVLGPSASPGLSVYYGLYFMLIPVLLAGVLPCLMPEHGSQRRWGWLAWLGFVLACVCVVHTAVAGWVLNVIDGWLAAELGLLDFGGASVLYLSTACVGIAWLLVAGQRGAAMERPTQWRGVAAIAALWAGSFAVTVGSEGVPGDIAIAAVLNTVVAPVCAVVAWMVVERIRHHRTSMDGATRGIFVGIVAITSSVDVVTPLWAGVLGLLAGALTSALAENEHTVRGLLITQLVAAVVGVAFVGILGVGVGGLLTGSWVQLGTQLYSVFVVAAVSFGFASVLTLTSKTLIKQFTWMPNREQTVR